MREKAQQIINFKMLRKMTKSGKVTYFINLLPTHFYKRFPLMLEEFNLWFTSSHDSNFVISLPIDRIER